MAYPDGPPAPAASYAGDAAARRRDAACDPAELVLPMFVKEGLTEPRPIASLPGVVQHSRESLRKAAAEAVAGRGRRHHALRRPRAAKDEPAPAASTRTASSTSRSATSSPRSATPPSS